MGDRQERGAAADCGESPRRAAVKLQLRRTTAPDNLEIAPQHALRVAGAERFHAGFLGGEPACKMNGGHAAARAIRDFAVGEYAAQKPISVPLDDVRNAVDVGWREADADDGGHYLFTAGPPPH